MGGAHCGVKAPNGNRVPGEQKEYEGQEAVAEAGVGGSRETTTLQKKRQ